MLDNESNNLTDYNGVFNIEIIGDKIIECHLRMGDINVHA
mgnify:CR=1 FL=1